MAKNITNSWPNFGENLWKACVGPLMEFPLTGERAYYFPQGHLEQLEPSRDDEVNQLRYDLPSKILCRVINIQLRAEEDTDDCFSQLTLLAEEDQSEPRNFDTHLVEPPRANIYSFCKVLTPSDMRSRYGLYVPRKHATKCFPPLDMSRETPGQELVVRDLHGNDWKFKHTFRGKPPRHMITTGWSAFVSSKRVVAGDTVIFLTGEEGELLIGVKRRARPTGITTIIGVNHLARPQSDPIPSTGISNRNVHQEILAVVCHALRVGSLFTVHCKPRLCQFIIPLNKYLEAVNNKFGIGMRIKMAFEGEDSSEMRFTGSIVEIGDICHDTWPNSSWRCLKIRWNGTSSIIRPENVSPWEIEPFIDSASEMPRTIVRKGKKKLRDDFNEQLVEGVDTIVSPRRQPKKASVVDQVPISDINYGDQLEYIPDFSVSDYTLALEGSDTWISDLLQGIDQDYLEGEREISIHQQPLLENTCHMPSQETRISSTYLIPHNGPDRGDELVPWGSYSIPGRCIPTLNRIITRYPELLSRFRAATTDFQTMSLKLLAEVVDMLEHLTIGSINQEQLDDSKRYLNDLKMSGIQVDWIEGRLLQIDAVFRKATLVQRHEKLVREVASVDRELEEVNFITGNNPLDADKSLMQDLL